MALGSSAQRIVLVGDSAGGNLVSAVTLRVSARHARHARTCACLSLSLSLFLCVCLTRAWSVGRGS
jgi:acetyl esterase/lipase